jgi:hypothetical protein
MATDLLGQEMIKTKMHERLTWVWRKRGSGSPESLCEFASFAPVRAAVKPRLRQALARNNNKRFLPMPLEEIFCYYRKNVYLCTIKKRNI